MQLLIRRSWTINFIFMIPGIWIRSKHARILLAECSILPKHLVHKNVINNEKKNKKKHIFFIVFCFMFHFRELGDRDINWPCLTEAVTLWLFFLLVVPVGAAHLCHNKLTWDQPSPYGHYQGINLWGYPDLWTLRRLETEQKAHTTSHCPTDHQRMSKHRHCPQTTTHCYRSVCASTKISFRKRN